MGKLVFGGLLYCLGCLTALANLTDLAEEPDWGRLDSFQKCISKGEFVRQLNEVYCPRKSWWSSWIEINQDSARIRKKADSDDWYDLQFLESNKSNGSSFPCFQISGAKIFIDPGHIGGEFSAMEGRHFALGNDEPVKEGDLALLIALALKSKLERKGAAVFLSRKQNQPVTDARPGDFKNRASSWFGKIKWMHRITEEEKRERIQKKADLYFYRVSEIMARRQLVKKTKPDLILCIHLNAAPWPDPQHKSLVSRNDYHVLVNGCYMGGEMAYDDQRFEMVWRLVNRWEATERLIAESMSRAFAQKTGLPAFAYKGPNALKIGKVEGVWARNLLANRIYEAPVVFLEPYIANSEAVYQRIQMGDYAGHKEINGQKKQSLVREYVDAVLLGLERVGSLK